MRAVEAAGGLHTIAISHPHYYGSMVEWAERFDARILLHEADREHVMRPSDRIELWSGDRYRIDDERELIRLGGHFAGGTVCLWRGGAAGRGALLSGDIVQVVADRDWVSFMYSYPNLIPLPAAEVERIRRVLETIAFDRIYGAWWGTSSSATRRRRRSARPTATWRRSPAASPAGGSKLTLYAVIATFARWICVPRFGAMESGV